MAKKRTAKKESASKKQPAKKSHTSRSATEQQDSKVRIDLRVEHELYEGITDLAKRTGVSLNQLMAGVTEWVLDNAVCGELYRGQNEREVTWRNADKVVSLGRTAEHGQVGIEDDEGRVVDVERGVVHPGIIYGVLDFNPKVSRRGD